MKLIKVKLTDLVPDPRNARKHNNANIEAIKQSLIENEQYRPFVVQRSSNKIAVGNGMYRAMMELGITEGWVEYRDLDERQFTRLALADNRTAELAEWDDVVLKELLTGLKPDEAIGWSNDELKNMLAVSDDLALELDSPAQPKEKTMNEYHCPKCGFVFEIKENET